MKYASICLMLLLLIIPACTKSGTATQVNKGTEVVADDAAAIVKKVLDSNAVQPAVDLKNPKSMVLETKPRAANIVKAEQEMAINCVQKFIEYAAKNGIDTALVELTKSRSGAFSSYIPTTYCYGAILTKVGGKMKIIAHLTSPDFVGIEVDTNSWADLTGWLFLKEAFTVLESGKTNQVNLENVYWKDPAWITDKPSRFSAYNRSFTINNTVYMAHFSTWQDE